MYFRRFSIALASTLAAGGAWYSYRGNPGDIASSANPLSTTGQQARALTSSTAYAHPAESATGASDPPVERKALVVDADQIYTGALTGTGPISKDTDDSGRKVLEMLTPEQATQRLRRNEESYFVGRGRGVLRYDVVQIPSNDPIEDDHSEKIVEVPQALATATGNGNSSDWMFWGVYDGHA